MTDDFEPAEITEDSDAADAEPAAPDEVPDVVEDEITTEPEDDGSTTEPES